MAANVETMAYYGDKPWHGLGVEVLQLMTAEEALRKGGLDWLVEKRKIQTVSEGGNGSVFIHDHFATVRNTDNYPLGIVGKIYQPVQNVDALDFMDALTKSGEAKYETVGSLQHGKIVWVMAKIPNGHGVDPVEPYLLCTTSHDGTTPVMVTATDVRVVCNNTLNAAVKGSKNKFRIRHTTNWADKITEAKRTLENSLKYFAKSHEVYDRMKAEKFTEVQLENLVLKVFKGTDSVDDLTGRQAKSFDDILGNVVRLSHTGKGTDLPGVQGTAWGAYNAITEFLDHHSDVKGGKGRRAEEVLMNSVWFGTIADKVQVTLDTITDQLKLAA